MSSYESSVEIWTRRFIHFLYILSLLIHCSSAFALAFVDAWIRSTYDQNRFEDKDFAFAVFLLIIFKIIYHGAFLWVDSWRYYIFQSEASKSFPKRLSRLFDFILLIFDAILLYQFPKWHGQFEANGDSRGAKYCILAIILLAIDLAWMFFLWGLWKLPAARALLIFRERTCEASADCEGGRSNIGMDEGGCSEDNRQG